jgi:uncharacterized protein
MASPTLARRATDLAQEFLGFSRVVILDGPRQSGKTTILRHLSDALRIPLRSFDDHREVAAASADPVAYLESFDGPVAIDEYQRAGNAFVLAIKLLCDRNPSPGQFLLAGSTNFLTSSQLSESLAGRVAIIPVRPFTQGEAQQSTERFIPTLFDDQAALPKQSPGISRAELAALVATGGFPDVLRAASTRARSVFFSSYADTVISREFLDDAGSARDLSILRRVFQVATARTGQELNLEALSSDAGISSETASHHVSLLGTLHQLVLVPGWASTAATRAKRKPKMVSVDSGLATFVMGHNAQSLADPHCHEFGQLVETFVIGELLRQATWEERCEVFHYRDRDQREVDLVLSNGRNVVGVEIKSSATVDTRWAKHLTYLGQRVGAKWRGGIVLYSGEHRVAIGPDVQAVPLSSLWATAEQG